MLYTVFTLAFLFLVGCGGGSGTLQMSMPTAPVEPKPPEFTPPQQSSQWQDNPNAEDPHDHWNHPQLLGLTPVDPADAVVKRGVIADLLTSADPASTSSATRFRNVHADDIEIIGERDGITYGQWKGGPAGTLNIEFDWRFGEEFSARTRARMDRTGKFWSRRLLDNFGTHVVKKGKRVFSRPSLTFEEDVSTDGILIAVRQAAAGSVSGGGPNAADITEDDYEPWLGSIQLRPQVPTGIMAHEMGHVLGVISHFGGWNVPIWERYVNRDDHTFEGPQSKIANGGNAVPFQWLNENLAPVPPNTPGATVDYGHLGVCASVMAYCRDYSVEYGPSELDFAFLADIGYEILDAETASEPEVYGYGAWGRYSAWGAGVERTLPAVLGPGAIEHDKLRAGADAFGIAPHESFAALHTPLQGTVTWTGSLIGVDLGSAKLPPVFGNATLSVELSNLTGTAGFDDLTVITDRATNGFRQSNLEYPISVRGNSFGDKDGRLGGRFFGPQHEEMAGILLDRAPTVNLLAGFGGRR